MNEFYIKSEIKEAIATITFFHPKSNSFPSIQLQNLIFEFEKLGLDNNVKIIVLQSEGKDVFCAGASFDELIQIKDFEKAKEFFMGFANLLITMRNCPKFIIGNIQGKVVGGGVGIISACDYAIALENASIRLSELSIGIGPFVIEPAISRKIGIQSFSELTLHPKEWKNANWVFEKGIYNKVYNNVTDLEKEVHNFSESLSKYSLDAMKYLKQIFWQGTENWETEMPKRAAMSGELLLTDYTQNVLKEIKS